VRYYVQNVSLIRDTMTLEEKHLRIALFVRRLTTPSDFHIPLPSIVPFAHS
jgi:hypothetical protein